MKVLERRAYRGPNQYALYPVVRLTVDLGPLEDYPSDRLQELGGFNDRLLSLLPTLRDHGCCFGEAGGFVRRLETGTWSGHILEHAAIALQNLSGGDPVSFGKTRGTGEPGCYHVVYSARDLDTALEAGEVAERLLQACLPGPLARELGVRDPGYDPIADINRFIDRAQRRRLGPSSRALVAAARARGIPVRRADEGALLRLGHGRHQKWLRATITGETSCVATELAGDKHVCNRLLADAGLPVPRQGLVEDALGAVRAARHLGFPVVVKPLDGNHGRGVAIGLQHEAEVRTAFERAARVRRRVLVEDYIDGNDYRLLVVGGRMVAAARRVPASVSGDGERTVAELVDRENRDPRRGDGHDNVLTRLELDDEALRVLDRQGQSPGTVPRAGQRVLLRRTGNLSTGGTAIDVTDQVHPDNRDAAVRAARVLGLDVAGVDFLHPDITRSWREVGGGICELNAAPGLRMHLAPTEGQPRDVAGAVIDHLYPPGAPATIPIAAITGTNGKTTTSRMLAHIYRHGGYRVGLATSDGVYIDGRLERAGDMTGPRSTRMVLEHPEVDCAVLEIARGGILRAGVGTQEVDIGACLNVANDHLGHEGIETVEQMAAIKRTIPMIARDTAVLNADCPHTAAMADRCRRARHIMWVSRGPVRSRVREHIARGGRAVVLEGDRELIVVHDQGLRIPLLAAGEIPATLGGAAAHNTCNAMFAAAMAHAAGLPAALIRAALRSFTSDIETTPGRMNLHDGHPFRVVVDWAHNPSGFQAIGEVVDRMDVAGRRICVVGSPGNRRDRDIREAARAVAPHFDLFVLRNEDKYPEGRAPDEIPGLYRDELLALGVPEDRILLVPDEAEANTTALSLARPGDLLVLFCLHIDQAWRQVVEFRPGESQPSETTTESAAV
jgi:cyanophycin synthetase